MMRARSRVGVGIVVLLVGACGESEDSRFGKGQFGSSGLAIESSVGDEGLLRSGSALQVRTGASAAFRANALHQVVVLNPSTGREIARTDLLTDPLGRLELASVAHDLGEFDGVKERDVLEVKIHDLKGGQAVAAANVPVVPTLHLLQGYGFQVDEVQPPYIFSARSDGQPANAFVVGALPEPGELAGPVFAGGRGFPANVATVDLYLVRDRDVWKNQPIPQRGQEGWVAGPIAAKVTGGVMQVTSLGWQPVGRDVGPYDLVVDVDRNGRFDFSAGFKDGADGEGKVGLTVQYSGAWLRARSNALTARGAADAAKAAARTASIAAFQASSAATNDPQATAKAKTIREAATQAQLQATVAETAAVAAEKAFNQLLADATICVAQASKAEEAARQAATFAKGAATDAVLTAEAEKAYDDALQARLTASHLIVNLAYGSSRRGVDDGWKNRYAPSERVYAYINPPVQRGEKHGRVAKVIVTHQEWAGFWNNPALVEPGGQGSVGRIPYQSILVQTQGATPQTGCTNAPPVAILDPSALSLGQVDLLRFDVIYDYGNDGYYDIGVDFLDVVSTRTDGAVVSGVELAKLPADQLYGFSVAK
ncbi:MAG: hypothetical protein IT371_26525 [Deltaproteobacteria bacterium]|nr:hypothetical protein [Deltaproteobacteria bacterium]